MEAAARTGIVGGVLYAVIESPVLVAAGAGICIALAVATAFRALDPEPEVAAKIVPNSILGLPPGVLDKILDKVCLDVSTANLYRLSGVSTEFRDSPILIAAKNSAKANYVRGMHHLKKEEYIQAILYLEKAATPKDEYKGHAKAQFYLGIMYEYGLGVEQDHAKAFESFKLSADQGDAEAQCNLGHMYHDGLGVKQDDKEAARLYQLSAEQGHAPAQFRLGYMYQFGLGVEWDHAKAVELFTLAADQGHAHSKHYLDGLLA
eukprot:COSAG01_NODE_93_length_27013_cov_41.515791_13_plen_262_part_00